VRVRVRVRVTVRVRVRVIRTQELCQVSRVWRQNLWYRGHRAERGITQCRTQEGGEVAGHY